MTALGHLSKLLSSRITAVERFHTPSDNLSGIIAELQEYNKSGPEFNVPQDLQQAAVRKFWDGQQFETLKDARLVSFGLCLPIRPFGPCIMEDRQRFRAVLDGQAGVDQWMDEPRWFRRCYQGLLRSYFMYDAKVDQTSAVAKQNWGDLRDYLNARASNIVDKQINPDWVTTVVDSRHLFGEDPCSTYAADVLSGDTAKFDYICEQVGITKSSWFQRELILSQIRQASKLNYELFKALIPRLLALLEKNFILRDQGLILILNRYVSTDQPVINELLQNASVEWWGNPWLPSNETRWGGVVPAARDMVSDWLKREFIEAFFTKLAEDGVGDRRRANFWLRYVKSMGNIQFALGARALSSKDRDFEALRKKMKGLYTELKTGDKANNAFIMTLGNLVAVEFGGMGNALYGYDVRQTLPFDASRPVGTTVNAPNSLKHKSRMLWMQHQDGINGWGNWEDMFEATLKAHFDIVSNAPMASIPITLPRQPQTPELLLQRPIIDQPAMPRRKVRSFSMSALDEFAQEHGFVVEDLRDSNGNLWARTGDENILIKSMLLDWGFRYKSGKGWWR